jgi:hypothetical protein
VDLFIAYRVGFVWFAASDMPDAANKVLFVNKGVTREAVVWMPNWIFLPTQFQ